MIDEQAVIDWVSQMIAHEPFDVYAPPLSFYGSYARIFSFASADKRSRLSIRAEFESGYIAQMAVTGKIDFTLPLPPLNSPADQNIGNIKIELDQPSTKARQAWSERILELLRTYGPDRKTWPRLAWERTRA